MQRDPIFGGYVEALRVVDVSELRIGEGPSHIGLGELADRISGTVSCGEGRREITRHPVGGTPIHRREDGGLPGEESVDARRGHVDRGADVIHPGVSVTTLVEQQHRRVQDLLVLAGLRADRESGGCAIYRCRHLRQVSVAHVPRNLGQRRMDPISGELPMMVGDAADDAEHRRGKDPALPRVQDSGATVTSAVAVCDSRV